MHYSCCTNLVEPRCPDPESFGTTRPLPQVDMTQLSRRPDPVDLTRSMLLSRAPCRPGPVTSCDRTAGQRRQHLIRREMASVRCVQPTVRRSMPCSIQALLWHRYVRASGICPLASIKSCPGVTESERSRRATSMRVVQNAEYLPVLASWLVRLSVYRSPGYGGPEGSQACGAACRRAHGHPSAGPRWRELRHEQQACPRRAVFTLRSQPVTSNGFLETIYDTLPTWRTGAF